MLISFRLPSRASCSPRGTAAPAAIPGPTFALYLSTLKLDKRAFAWGITLLLVVSNISQVVSYLHLGLYAGGLLLGSAALAPALLVGQQLGVRIQDRLTAPASIVSY